MSCRFRNYQIVRILTYQKDDIDAYGRIVRVDTVGKRARIENRDFRGTIHGLWFGFEELEPA